MAWQVILEAAAELFVKGFAKSLGESLGQAAGDALAKAIFGGDNNEAKFESEVISRLIQIETKLNQIIGFLNDELPRLIVVQSTTSALQLRVKDIRSDRVSIQNFISDYSTNKSDLNAVALRQAAEQIAGLGFTLAQSGPIWYYGTFEAFLSCFSAYSRLIRNSDKNAQEFGPNLKNWAKQYLEFANSWLDATNEDMPPKILAVKIGELQKANSIIDQTPIGNYLLGMYGQPLMYAGSPPVRLTTDGWVGMKAWSEKEGNTWGGDWGGGEQKIIEFPAGTPPDPASWKQRFGWKILDFAPPPMVPMSKSQLSERFAQVNAAINNAQWQHDRWPKQIDELQIAVGTISFLKQACEKILTGP